MGQSTSFPTVSLTDARTGKRVRVSAFEPGDALVPAPQPIVGYCYQAGHLTVYVNGTMPLAMRSALEDNHTEQEVWLVPEPPAGIQEITLPDHRREFFLQKLPNVMLIDLPTSEEMAANNALMHEVLQELRQVRTLLARPADELLTREEVAARTKHTVKTVDKWLNEGKHDTQGRLIKLAYVEYAPGFKRVPLAALEAYGRSIGFEVASLPTATSPLPVLDSAKALRRAS